MPSGTLPGDGELIQVGSLVVIRVLGKNETVAHFPRHGPNLVRNWAVGLDFTLKQVGLRRPSRRRCQTLYLFRQQREYLLELMGCSRGMSARGHGEHG
jgi:hypothetical protein